MSQTVRIFCSYSSKDEDFKRELLTQLSPLERESKVQVWHFPLIASGHDWNREIKQHLADADIVLLLISPDFLASEYIMSIELASALERHELGLARVIPIICRASSWRNEVFAKLNALPRGAKPIKNWEDRDEAWLDVATNLRKEVESIYALERRANAKVVQAADTGSGLSSPNSANASSATAVDQSQTFSFRFEEYRDPLTYHVTLYDEPQPDTEFLVPSKEYTFYESELAFSLKANHPANQVTVAIITDLSTYSQRLNSKKLIYGEVVQVNRAEKTLWDNHMRSFMRVHDIGERLALLSKIMKLSAMINDEPMTLAAIQREPFGFELCFELPRAKLRGNSIDLQFKCQSFQPRALAHFPFIISALTRNLEFRVDYSDLSIESASYFAGFPFNRSPDILNDSGTRVLSVKSRTGEWMFPGSGLVLHWK